MDIKRTTHEITNLVTTNSKLEAEINAIVVKMNLDAQQTKNYIATLGLIKAQIDNYNAQTSPHIVTGKQIGRAHV